MSRWPDDDVILYDGVCVLCSRWVRFIAARDKAARFRFTPIQSAYGTRLAQAFGIDPDDPDTNAVVHGGVAFFKSDAALTVLSHLPGWGWTRALFAVVRRADEREELRFDPPSICWNETHDRGRNAVERRAGHEPDVDVAAVARGVGHADVTGGGARLMTRRITPPCSASSRIASSREAPVKCMTIAVFTVPPAASRRLRASSRATSHTSMRIL